MTVTDYATRRGITFFAAKADLKRLVDARHLRRSVSRGTVIFTLRTARMEDHQ